MDFEIEVIRNLPVEQIHKFEDRTVYNMAVLTREFTKSANAFPYLTGTLYQSEIALPILNPGDKEYCLGAGVDYATRVWTYKNAQWTNPSTKPQWYATILNLNAEQITVIAVQTALKEI